MGLLKFRPLVKSCFFKKSCLVFIEQKLTTIMKEQKYSLVWTGDLKDSLQRISTLRYRILFDLFHKILNGRSARSANPHMPQVPLSTFLDLKWHFENCSCMAITPSAFNMFRLDASCRQHLDINKFIISFQWYVGTHHLHLKWNPLRKVVNKTYRFTLKHSLPIEPSYVCSNSFSLITHSHHRMDFYFNSHLKQSNASAGVALKISLEKEYKRALSVCWKRTWAMVSSPKIIPRNGVFQDCSSTSQN